MPDPNVRDLLLGKVDEITARMAELLDEVKRVTAVGRSDVGRRWGRGRRRRSGPEVRAGGATARHSSAAARRSRYHPDDNRPAAL